MVTAVIQVKAVGVQELFLATAATAVTGEPRVVTAVSNKLTSISNPQPWVLTSNNKLSLVSSESQATTYQVLVGMAVMATDTVTAATVLQALPRVTLVQASTLVSVFSSKKI